MATLYEKNFRHHSKTFSFAARFFGAKHAQATAKLYYFFRFVDDIADSDTGCYKQKSLKIKKSLHSKELADIRSTYNIPNEIIESFLQTSINDINFKKMNCKKDLLNYCYGVASTVGLSMCHVLGVRNKNAYYHAIDLGVAMQLTNICRDVYEDYECNRIYLPELEQAHFKKNNQHEIFKIQLKYLDLADSYYKSGFEGLTYLPFRVRIVIFIAGKLYQMIGPAIINDKNYKKRSYVSLTKKVILTIALTPIFILKQMKTKKYRHNHELHTEIKNLPCAHV